MLDSNEEWWEHELGQQIYNNFTEGMNNFQASEWAKKIESSVDLAKTWQNTNWEGYKDAIIG
jgi:hypothetical protein